MRAGYARITRRVACFRFGAGDDFKVRRGGEGIFRVIGKDGSLDLEEICIRGIEF